MHVWSLYDSQKQKTNAKHVTKWKKDAGSKPYVSSQFLK